MVKKAKSEPSGQGTLVDLLVDGFVRALRAEADKEPNQSETRVEDDQLTEYNVQMLALAGTWTPERAEAWAKRRGFPPFAGKPDAASYDPSKELGWTPLMSLVWIVYRDMNEVREVLPEYIVAHKEWVQRGEGWGVAHVKYEYAFERNRNYLVNPIGAVRELWRKLASGELSASGRKVRDDVRRVIPREEWYELKQIDCKRIGEAAYGGLYSVRIGGAPQRAYSEVRLAAEEVLRVFPSPERKRPTTATATKGKLSKPEAVAAVLRRLFPNERPSMNNNELAMEVGRAEPGIGKFSPRTLSRAIAIAWPLSATRRQITPG